MSSSGLLLRALLTASFLGTVVRSNSFLGQTPFSAFASRASPPGTALYRFFAQEGALTNYTLVGGGNLFALEESTGALKTRRHFPRSGPSWYALEVSALDAAKQQLTAILNVTVTAEWVLAPMLEHYAYLATVTESAALQSNLYVIPDVTNARITAVRGYSLHPQVQTGHYLIAAGNTNDDLAIDGFGVLSSAKPLDRERTESYRLVVRYTDGIASVSATVNVTVADINDNFPRFSQDLYTFSLAENSAVGRTVGTLTAVDPDARENGTVTYSLGNFNNCSYLDIVPSTGALVTIAQPNYESGPACALAVVARDGGTPPLSATAIVSVAISNVDDECPKFVNGEYSVEVGWNSTQPPPGTVSLAFLRAFDPDNFTADLVYSLQSRNITGNLFEVNAFTGELVLLPTTSDPTGVYVLNVSAKDAVCQSYVQVTVVISSPNLHPPQFSQKVVQVNMTENPLLGTVVAILNATDADTGSNGAIRFSLGSPSTLFAVNKITGAVYTTAPPSMYDSETGPPTTSLVVLVTDGGGRIDDCLLQVTLINQNDNAPSFPLSSYSLTVYRGIKVGGTVLQVYASDPDPRSGGLVRYLLSPSSQPFSIGATSGNITTTGNLTANSYMLYVTAQDQAPPFNNATITVNITISTTQPPVWPQTLYDASVREFASAGTPVLTIATSNPSATYSTLGINYRSNELPSTFSISSSGNISVGTQTVVNHHLLRPFSDYLFIVSALATCGASLCNTLTTVRIAVIPINNNPLQFSQQTYSAVVLEGQDVGSFVAFIQATDVDFNQPTYTLTGTDKFSISPEGILRTAAILSPTDSPYFFIVSASYLTQTATKYITVTVTSVSVPHFTDSSFVRQLPEDVQVGSSVFNAAEYAVDDDAAAVLSFSIVDPTQDMFTMSANGSMFLAQQLNYKQQSTYNLTIQLFDGKHTAHATLSIVVLRVPSTVSPSEHYRGQMTENQPAGVFVANINSSHTATFAYQLLGEAQGRFVVSPEGAISVAGEVDRESLLHTGQATFLAVVQTNATLHTTNVTVNVLDVNDCYPNFQCDYVAWIQENTTPLHGSSYVTQVTAVDQDAGNNGTVTYALLPGPENGFTIDPVTGVITTNYKYNREVSAEYIIVVQARDNGTPSQLSSTALVLVEIGDVNDNAPSFLCSPMYARVPENTPVGTTVFTFEAVDPDSGPNGTVVFGIVSDNSSDLFVIDASMQGLKLNAPLNYSAGSSHTFMFTISLQDKGVPPLAGIPGVLLVEVVEVNTIAPVILCTLLQNFNSTINENTPTGTTVANIVASSPKARLSYTIAKGNERGDFRISTQQTGSATLQIARDLSYAQVPSYKLIIVVSDDGSPPLSSSCILSLTIGNVYNLAPLFQQRIYEGYVYENSGPNAHVLAVSATTRSSGHITGYYIVLADSNGFILNSTTGELSTNASFVRAIQSQYLLTVAAVDSFSLSATVTVAINVHPAPKGGVVQVQLVLLDNTTPTHELGAVPFNNSNDAICTNCIITTGDMQFFSVNWSTCVLSVIQPGPSPGVYTFMVQGNCSSTPYSNRTSTIVVNVSSIFSNQIPGDMVIISLHTTASAFLSYGGWFDFPAAMAAVLSADTVTLLNVQDSSSDPNVADVAFYARTQSGYLSQTRMLQAIFLKRDALASRGYRMWNLPSDPCDNSSCLNSGSCIPLQNITHTPNVVVSPWQVLSSPRINLGYQCSCLPGSSGTTCEINFDDCYSNPCQGHATCVDGLQAFKCICPPWSTGDTCSVLIDDCPPGYYGDRCQHLYFIETPYCASNPCQNGATCSSGEDSFTCYCPVGFTGQLCEKTATYQGGCVRNPCLHGSTCQEDASSSPVCSCSAGFSGPTCCWPIDNCERQPCENGGTCTTGLYGSYLCTCAPGYRGVNCTEPVPACESAPCLNGGWCSEAPNGSFTCVCPHQYYGPTCESSVLPEDLCASSPCPGNSMCTFGRTGYTCSCPDGFLAPGCSSPASLPCDSAPCLHGGSCTNSASGFLCNCSQGFGGNRCQTSISMCASSPCHNDGTCIDGIGAYSCRCKAGISGPTCDVYCPTGYTGDHCDQKTVQCATNFCLNGGTCAEGAALPTCVCPPTFTGPRCGTACGVLGTTCDQAVSFAGAHNLSSYRTYAPLAFNGPGRISLVFATSDLNGLLMYSAGYQDGSVGDYFAVEIEEGYLKVRLSLVGGAPAAVKSVDQVNDGSWHRMDVSFSNKELSVLLDYCSLLNKNMLPYARCASEVAVFSTQSSLNLGLPLWIGGVPFSLDGYSISNRGITACVRYLVVNSQLTPLNGQVDQLNSQIGCSQLNNSCQPGVCGAGACVQSWNGFRCVCPKLKGGPECNQATEQFTVSGGGYQRYSLLIDSIGSTYSDQVELWFMTSGSDGVLFYMASGYGEYATVVLQSGLVTFSTDLGEGAYSVTANGVLTNDGQWHYVSVNRTALRLSLTVDNVTFTANFTGLFVTLEIDPTMVYAGGYPASDVGTGYSICLQDIRVGSYPLPASGSNQNGVATSSMGTHRGCGPCSLNPCGTGLCSLAVDGTVLCACPDGTTTTTLCTTTSVPVLGIYLGAFVGFFVVISTIALAAIVAWRCQRNRRRLKSLPNSLYYAAKREMDILVPADTLVIANDTGCGEEDTAMDDLHLGLQSAHPILPAPTVEVPTGDARSDSPVIEAVLHQLVEEHRLHYTDLDATHPYSEEGENSSAGSLSSICSELEKETNSVEWLNTAGPQFKRIAPVLRHLLLTDQKNAEIVTNL